MIQRNLTAVITASLIFISHVQLSAQINSYPCETDDNNDVFYSLTIPNGNANQSTILGDGIAEKAVDGNFDISSTARSKEEINPLLELDLGEIKNLNNLQIYYPQGEAMQKYYILLSETPFGGSNLADEIANQEANHIFVGASIPSGAEIPLDNQAARYIRIQLADKGQIVITEILLLAIPGGGVSNDENCNNGEDDDCDGLVDCEDPDCVPFATITYTDPSCPICGDGKIYINPYGQANDLMFSIDGGQSFTSCVSVPDYPTYCGFFNLNDGDYDVVVTNQSCTKETTIELRSPPGGSHGHCFNGGFEEGTFEGWTGGLGANSAGVPNFFNENFQFGDRQSIISTSQDSDMFAGSDIPFTPPSGGTYFAKLGNADSGSRVEKLTYCFVIDNENADFHFYYATVLNDGGDDHNDINQPFFQWRALDVNGNVINDEEDKIIADVNNNFFEVQGSVVWKGWTCQDVDLTDEIGEEVCLEFVTADCSEGLHFGYAYIDALCSTNEDVAPLAILNLNETYCLNQIVSATDAGSLGYNQYSWRVCRYNENGNPFECFSTNQTIGYTIPDFEDILNFFFEKNSPNTGLNCKDRFKVTLTLYNDCGSSSDSKDFIYICEESIVDYDDILFCGGSLNLLITGENDCDGCPVTWTPEQYLDDPNIAFPTLLGDLNTNTLDQTYSVEVKNDFGCIYEDEINVYGRDDIKGTVDIEVIDLNHCERTFEVNVQLENKLSSSVLVVTLDVEGETPFFFFTDEAPDNYPEFPLKRFIATATVGQTSDNHTYTIPEIFSKRYNLTVTATVSFIEITEDWTVYGNCAISGTTDVEAGRWHGSIIGILPNVMSLDDNSNSNNQIFGPIISNNPIAAWPEFQNRNAYEAMIKVFDRWGGLGFEAHFKSDLSDPTAGIAFVEPSLQWDGTIDGEEVGQGVYAWIFDVQNCDQQPAGCVTEVVSVESPDCSNGFNTAEDWCIEPTGPMPGCDCSWICWDSCFPRFCGDVTVID